MGGIIACFIDVKIAVACQFSKSFFGRGAGERKAPSLERLSASRAHDWEALKFKELKHALVEKNRSTFWGHALGCTIDASPFNAQAKLQRKRKTSFYCYGKCTIHLFFGIFLTAFYLFASKCSRPRQNRIVETAMPVSPQPDAAHDPVERIDGRPDAGVLLLCDHATNALPESYAALGLPPSQLERHIAYDIGAAWMTRRLAELLEAPAILSRFSRLLIDPNRGADDPTLVMRISDGNLIPGNARIGAQEIECRRNLYWRPYREAIAAKIEAMMALGPLPAIISIHTFTPFWKTKARPWEIGILWDSDPRFARPLIAALAEDGIVVGDNQPYDGALAGDTLDEEVTRRGLAGVLIETRQDLVAKQDAADAWAGRLAPILRPILGRPELHRIEFHKSRTGRHA